MAMRRGLVGITDPLLLKAYATARGLLRRSYVTGVSIGVASRNGTSAEFGVCVHVEQKLPVKVLTRAQRLPSIITGIPVNVIERKFLSHGLTGDQRRLRRVQPQDPVAPGLKVTASGGEPGTLGVMVADLLSTTDEPCFLTAGHVFNVPEGTLVYQPREGPPDRLLGQVLRRTMSPYCDGAIAVVDSERSWTNLPIDLDHEICGCRQVQLGDILVKSGIMTGVTRARVEHIGEFKVHVPPISSKTMSGFVLQPCDESIDEPICEGGDSGSIWYDERSGLGVGMHVAGDTLGPGYADDAAYACHLDQVLYELDAEIIS